MEVDTAPPATDNSAEPQYMQRKLVSKTYVNEEGYMGRYCISHVYWDLLLNISKSKATVNDPALSANKH